MRVAAPSFSRCLEISAVLHLSFFLLARGLSSRSFRTPVEVDLTYPFIGSGAAKLGAPKSLAPDAKGPVLPAETPATEPAKPQPPKDWVLPGPRTQTMEKPAPPPPTPGGTQAATGTSPLSGGLGEGGDYGVKNGIGDGGAPLSIMPRLLNRDEVLRNLRRFYPEKERRAGREGTVLVNIHIGADGLVGGADVVVSAGAAFDAAAKGVAKLMRFSPAIGRSGQPVGVKISQSMVFQLSD